MIHTLDTIYLYRMMHIDNVPHLLQFGITHKSSPNANPYYVPIGDSSLISTRATFPIPLKGDWGTLGDYIPFYFGVRMPMLYVIQHGGNFVPNAVSPKDIVYVAVSLQSFLSTGQKYCFTDGHATDAFTGFYDASRINDLPKIVCWDSVAAEFWKDTAVKRQKQAEFLIMGDIAPQHIRGYVCYNVETKEKLANMGVDKAIIKVYPKAYY